MSGTLNIDHSTVATATAQVRARTSGARSSADAFAGQVLGAGGSTDGPASSQVEVCARAVVGAVQAITAAIENLTTFVTGAAVTMSETDQAAAHDIKQVR